MTKRIEQVQALVERDLKDFSSESLLDNLKRFKLTLSMMIGRHEALDETFEKANMKEIWAGCGECSSPVLLNYGDCPYCGTALISKVEEPVKKDKTAKEEVKEDEPVKEKPAKKTKKVKEEAKPKKSKPVKEKVVEEEDEGDEPPSEEEINKMRRPSLIKLITEFELDVDADSIKKTTELRKAINDEFEDEEEDDDTETSDDVSSDELADFDLSDVVDDDDEDDDVFDD